MADVCGDNRFEIIAKVKEHLLKASNIEMYPEELKQVDNILFRLWQLGYFNQSELEKENEELEKQTNYAKLYYQEVISLHTQLKTLKDKYKEVKKNNIKAKKILKTIADNWKGSGLSIEKYRMILKAYNDAEIFFKEIKENG